MSAWDSAPTVEDDLTADELEEWLQETFNDIADQHAERKHHDQDAYFAHLAGDPECLALGHAPDEHGEWDPEDGIHESGWDGDLLCTATKFGTACSSCEGECSVETPPSLWSLPGVRA